MKVQILFLLGLFCGMIHCQDDCVRITIDDLGTTGSASTTGLISQVLDPGGDGLALPDVTVMNINIVCEAQHMLEDRYRYTSVVVTFTCSSTDSRLTAQCPETGSMVHTEQFTFGCDNTRSWTPMIISISDFVRTVNTTATLTTPRDTSCSLCINPDHPSAADITVTNDTHCAPCPASCTNGLQRCSSASTCCSYFNNGSCVNTCPGALVPGGDNQCGCVELSDGNGEFSYSDGQNVGSTATLDCNDGYSESTTTAECMESGWSATPVCNRVDCGDVNALTNGELSYSDGTYAGSVVTYTCNTEYLLEGTSTRMCQNSGTWTLTAPTCTVCSELIDSCTSCDANGQDVMCTGCQDGLVVAGNGACTSPTSCGVGCIIGIVVGAVVFLILLILLIILIVWCCVHNKDNSIRSKTV